ncbi:MAG: adenosylcobinamide-GDP ribazoletransferase, partial [Halobacteriaceae archaeon]
MVLTALRGALGFLSRAPVGRDERAWRAFRSTPAALPLAGYAIGAAVALPLALPLPGPTAAALFVAAVYLVTGINHLDGVADLGDAAVVHGDAGRRRAVMADAELGVGGTAAVALVVFALGAAGLAVAALGLRALALVVAAEVGAKLAVAAVACLGSAAHEGLGAELTARMP